MKMRTPGLLVGSVLLLVAAGAGWADGGKDTDRDEAERAKAR